MTNEDSDQLLIAILKHGSPEAALCHYRNIHDEEMIQKIDLYIRSKEIQGILNKIKNI